MNFGTIILYQSMETRQNYDIQILAILLFTLKPKIFLKIFLMMLRNGLIRLTVIKRIKYLFQQGKIKKVSGLFKDELGGKIITGFVALRPKAYSYLDDDGNKHKKYKGTKRCVIKQKTMFQKIVCSIIKMFIDHNKDLKAIIMMFTQKKLIRLR